uniref:Uncharacterized protein n=1 Tax=Sphaerodactylus townsendi TaxID=933632 RepID=A0ACB8FD82_9SAUR
MMRFCFSASTVSTVQKTTNLNLYTQPKKGIYTDLTKTMEEWSQLESLTKDMATSHQMISKALNLIGSDNSLESRNNFPANSTDMQPLPALLGYPPAADTETLHQATGSPPLLTTNQTGIELPKSPGPMKNLMELDIDLRSSRVLQIESHPSNSGKSWAQELAELNEPPPSRMLRQPCKSPNISPTTPLIVLESATTEGASPSQIDPARKTHQRPCNPLPSEQAGNRARLETSKNISNQPMLIRSAAPALKSLGYNEANKDENITAPDNQTSGSINNSHPSEPTILHHNKAANGCIIYDENGDWDKLEQLS